ncbi:uncharacterized protein DEA37_0011925 [Paragonimus westermani]|uniref:palmitoyl-protein hydrolase n=1 Tax=Paragonimus westermani TaxID=34504 RepID=A0A5J4NPM0_9TREM|nr:uncharacterized protein DEA37_0011925 [Paragonimus westermani]
MQSHCVHCISLPLFNLVLSFCSSFSSTALATVDRRFRLRSMVVCECQLGMIFMPWAVMPGKTSLGLLKHLLNVCHSLNHRSLRPCFPFLSVDRFVQAEIDSGIPADRIVIGGFSQGGSVALYNALTKNRNYGGVTCLSCWLPLHTKLLVDQTLVTVPRDLAVFQCHGTDDCIVPFEMGQATYELLKRFQMSKCEFLSYQNLGHSSNDQEISDLQSFLKKRLPPS